VGEENALAQARQLIGVLRALAVKNDLVVVLIAHPSLSGMTTRSGQAAPHGAIPFGRGSMLLDSWFTWQRNESQC
jgi:hypothetical protein